MEEPTACESFESMIWDVFGGLISRDEARILARESYADERCMLALEVSGIRVMLLLEFSAVSIFIGSANSTPGWSAAKRESQWWALPRVLDYLEGRPKPTLAEVRKQAEEWRSQGIKESLAKHAQRLEPRWADIIHLFDGSAPESEWVKFARYYNDRSALRAEIRGG